MSFVDKGSAGFIKVVEKLWKCEDCNGYRTTEILYAGQPALMCLECNDLKVAGVYDNDGHPDYLNADSGEFKCQ